LPFLREKNKEEEFAEIQDKTKQIAKNNDEKIMLLNRRRSNEEKNNN
jgi:hypothetical protein